jgi:putative solute:sodium symporter small subunit
MLRAEFATGPLAANALRVRQTRGNKVATDVPVSDNPARDRHQLTSLILAIAILTGALAAVILAIAAAAALNQYWFLHFPLGFFVLAQGVLFVLIALAFWFVHVQERLDQRRSESTELV